MDDFDQDYYKQIKEMLDHSIPNQAAYKLISRSVVSTIGTFQTYNNGSRVGFAEYEAATVLEVISPEEIVGVNDWAKMKQCLELIALEQEMGRL